jgi:subtilisin family serine protease
MPQVREAAPKVDIGLVLGHADRRFNEDSPAEVAAWIASWPSDALVDRAVEMLAGRGFEVIGRSRCTLSLRASPELVKRVFGAEIVCTPDHNRSGTYTCKVTGGRIAVPAELRAIVGSVALQPPARNQAAPSATPPPVAGAYYLNVLDDVPRLLRAKKVHDDDNNKGTGVRLAMIDTGFDHNHPFFTDNGFASTRLLAGGATSKDTDSSGHGTGCSANAFVVAPGIEFIGIKIGDDIAGTTGSAPLLAGFQRALGFDPAHPTKRSGDGSFKLPQIISVSVTCGEPPEGPSWGGMLPAELTPLEACVREAVLASNIVVVAAAGNLGERGFPGQMKTVIAAGGVFKPKHGALKASNFASAFTSGVYPGRKVPDVCGLCGESPHADYILLPVPPGSDHDVEFGAFDGTTKVDGWARFSGTSAAAPQLAGICALLLEKNSGLSPQDVKALLKSTAVDVTKGAAADMGGTPGLPAGPGVDRATGGGLADAKAAFDKA